LKNMRSFCANLYKQHQSPETSGHTETTNTW